jgi:hypothetical protein
VSNATTGLDQFEMDFLYGFSDKMTGQVDMEKYPEARFEIVAVHPEEGNAAQVAIETTKSRRNAERVLRSLTQMGLPMDKVDVSYAGSNNADSSEVHIYIR